MHSINKKTFIFYLFLCLLLISKLIAIINATYIMDGIEKQSLFTAASIAHGVPPLPSFFQADEPRCGGGPFLLSTLAVPFIVLLGKSYFSLRLASLVILVIIYITTFKFCEKYFGVAAAVCASLLLIITPATITQYSIVAYGRHYHLNLFFMLSLYLFAKIKESGQTRYYVLLSLICGLGVYFYPAFLVTAFCMGLMLLSESNIKKPSSFFQYSLIIIGIIIGGHFLSSGMPWYRNIYTVVFHNGAKDVALSGTLFSVLTRFILLICYYIPNLFSSPQLNPFGGADTNIFLIFSQSSFWDSPSIIFLLSVLSLGLFRIVFIATILVLAWINRSSMKKIIYNIFSLVQKRTISPQRYISSFLLVHIFIYAFVYGLNDKQLHWGQYFTPLFSNIILILTVVIAKWWKQRRIFAVCALLCALSPGIVFQFHMGSVFSFENFYQHYIFFYEPQDTFELFLNKDESIHRRMGDVLNVKIFHTLGGHYRNRTDQDYISNTFAYLGNSNVNKMKRLYQGYIEGVFLQSKGNLRETLSVIKKIDKKHWPSCYKGLGEGVITRIFNIMEGDFNSGRDKNIIANGSIFVADLFKPYFFQGVGEGLAKQFAQPYHGYITEEGFYDEEILRSYKALIDDKYKNDFLAGFHNNDVWSDF